MKKLFAKTLSMSVCLWMPVAFASHGVTESHKVLIEFKNPIKGVSLAEFITCELTPNAIHSLCDNSLRITFSDGGVQSSKLDDEIVDLLTRSANNLFRGTTKVIKKPGLGCRMLPPTHPFLLSVVQTTFGGEATNPTIEAQDLVPIYSDDNCAVTSRITPEDRLYEAEAKALVERMRMVVYQEIKSSTQAYCGKLADWGDSLQVLDGVYNPYLPGGIDAPKDPKGVVARIFKEGTTKSCFCIVGKTYAYNRAGEVAYAFSELTALFKCQRLIE